LALVETLGEENLPGIAFSLKKKEILTFCRDHFKERAWAIKHGISPNTIPNEARFQEYMSMHHFRERKTTRKIALRVKRQVETYNKIKYVMEEGKSKIGPMIEQNRIESKKRVSSALDQLKNRKKVLRKNEA